jgi:hypothetical protein
MSYAEFTFPKVPWRPVGFSIEVLCRHSKMCVWRAYIRTILPAINLVSVFLSFSKGEGMKLSYVCCEGSRVNSWKTLQKCKKVKLTKLAGRDDRRRRFDPFA